MDTLAAETAAIIPPDILPTDNPTRPALEPVAPDTIATQTESEDPLAAEAAQYAYESVLIAQAKLGEEAAIGELYKLHRSSLIRYAVGLLGCNNIYLAEDLVQEAFMRTFKALHDKFEDHGKGLGAYLTRAVYTRVLDAAKHKKALPIYSQEPLALSEKSTFFTASNHEVLSVEDEVIKREDFLQALQILHGLTAGQRFVVIGHAFGVTYDELAVKLTHIMGKPINTAAIKALHYRAKEKIQEALEPPKKDDTPSSKYQQHVQRLALLRQGKSSTVVA